MPSLGSAGLYCLWQLSHDSTSCELAATSALMSLVSLALNAAKAASDIARAHFFQSAWEPTDWVVLYGDDGPREHRWTIITSAFGPMRGRRIVRGREAECVRLYEAASAPTLATA
jgi:hypothetical protein